MMFYTIFLNNKFCMQLYYSTAQKYDVVYRQYNRNRNVSEQCTQNERYVNNNSENYNFVKCILLLIFIVLYCFFVLRTFAREWNFFYWSLMKLILFLLEISWKFLKIENWTSSDCFKWKIHKDVSRNFSRDGFWIFLVWTGVTIFS